MNLETWPSFFDGWMKHPWLHAIWVWKCGYEVLIQSFINTSDIVWYMECIQKTSGNTSPFFLVPKAMYFLKSLAHIPMCWSWLFCTKLYPLRVFWHPPESNLAGKSRIFFDDFPMIFPWFPRLSHHFPLIFLWFSLVFLWFPWFSYDFPMIYRGFPLFFHQLFHSGSIQVHQVGARSVLSWTVRRKIPRMWRSINSARPINSLRTGCCVGWSGFSWGRFWWGWKKL